MLRCRALVLELYPHRDNFTRNLGGRRFVNPDLHIFFWPASICVASLRESSAYNCTHSP
jgi:hypothetical protein